MSQGVSRPFWALCARLRKRAVPELAAPQGVSPVRASPGLAPQGDPTLGLEEEPATCAVSRLDGALR
jgi:hypothetical protein